MKKKSRVSAQETITAPVLEKLFYAMYDAIDNLDSDTMESTLEEMTHFIYPDNQQEFLNQLKTAVSDIDVEQCTKILEHGNLLFNIVFYQLQYPAAYDISVYTLRGIS